MPGLHNLLAHVCWELHAISICDGCGKIAASSDVQGIRKGSLVLGHFMLFPIRDCATGLKVWSDVAQVHCLLA